MSDPFTLEWLGGRPVLNSVNLEEGDAEGTRLDTFLRPKVIRHMVSQKNDRLDFAAIMKLIASAGVSDEELLMLADILSCRDQYLESAQMLRRLRQTDPDSAALATSQSWEWTRSKPLWSSQVRKQA